MCYLVIQIRSRILLRLSELKNKKRAEFAKGVRRSSMVEERKWGQASTRKRHEERERERSRENVRAREETDIQRRNGRGAVQARLEKTVFDERRRFVFVAGLEGTGLILSLFLFPLHLVLKLTSCKVSAL